MQYNNPYMNLPVQPTTSTPMYQQPYMMPQQQMPIQQPQPQQRPQNDTLNNGGLIVVPNEEEVHRYPVAPGNLVTFKIENQPIIIEKSMGRSQFDTPQYVKYTLSKADMNEEDISTTSNSSSELAEIKKIIEHIDVQIDILKDNYSDMNKTINKLNKVKEVE